VKFSELAVIAVKPAGVQPAAAVAPKD
jgi:hypothetical protein